MKFESSKFAWDLHTAMDVAFRENWASMSGMAALATLCFVLIIVCSVLTNRFNTVNHGFKHIGDMASCFLRRFIALSYLFRGPAIIDQGYKRASPLTLSYYR